MSVHLMKEANLASLGNKLECHEDGEGWYSARRGLQMSGKLIASNP